jgi:hypothetical protein
VSLVRIDPRHVRAKKGPRGARPVYFRYHRGTKDLAGMNQVRIGVLSQDRASVPIPLEPSCRHGASDSHRSKLCELPQVLGRDRA